jgi:putative nucleotidyltransferase with HDIG domain
MAALPPLSELRNRHPEAFRVSETLRAAGFHALFAGGCVRDWLLGRAPKDIDLASDALPEQVEALFPRTHALGRAFGVMQVIEGAAVFEVTTFRQDLAYADGRHPEGMVPSSPEEDARRRDFTLNGLFLSAEDGELLDYVGGLADLRAGVVRAIGDPETRFREDHLRMLRGVRFAQVLGFAMDPATREAIRRRASDLHRISAERVRDEFVRLLTESPRPGDAVAALDDCGLLREILPEFLELRGCEQPPEWHPEGDVWTHTLMMLNELRHPSPALALAVLLHDIGKPATRTVDAGGRVRFTGHAQTGARMAERWMRRMKFSNALRQTVAGYVDRHMNFIQVERMRPATRRRLVASPSIGEELELHRIDCLCSNGITGSYETLLREKEELDREEALPAAWIDGRDLLRIGLRGPELGEWKRKAYDEQLEGCFADRESLLDWVRRSAGKA